MINVFYCSLVVVGDTLTWATSEQTIATDWDDFGSTRATAAVWNGQIAIFPYVGFTPG